jgi:hypothetical protein
MCARRRIAVDAWDGFAAHLDACVEIRIGNVTDLSLLAPSSVNFAFANNLFEHVSQGDFSAVLYHLRTTDGRWNVKYSATIYVRPLLAGVPVVTLAGLMQPTVLRGRTWPELIVAGLVCGAVYVAITAFACVAPHHRAILFARIRMPGTRCPYRLLTLQGIPQPFWHGVPYRSSIQA